MWWSPKKDYGVEPLESIIAMAMQSRTTHEWVTNGKWRVTVQFEWYEKPKSQHIKVDPLTDANGLPQNESSMICEIWTYKCAEWLKEEEMERSTTFRRGKCKIRVARHRPCFRDAHCHFLFSLYMTLLEDWVARGNENNSKIKVANMENDESNIVDTDLEFRLPLTGVWDF